MKHHWSRKLSSLVQDTDPDNPKCNTNVDPPWIKAFFLSIISLFFWVPLLVLVLLYAVIARHLTAAVQVQNYFGKSCYWHSTMQMTTHAGSTSQHHGAGAGAGAGQGQEPAAVTRGRRQIVIMLGTVVLFFFACLLPFKVTRQLDNRHLPCLFICNNKIICTIYNIYFPTEQMNWK